jgi:hypothetical protein
MDHGEMKQGGMGWIVLVQDTEKWKGLVDTVTNLLLHEMLRSF